MSTLTNPVAYDFPAAADPNGFAAHWRRWWFEPVAPLNLALCRIIFFALLFHHHWDKDFASWATLPRSFFHPVWIFEFLRLPVLPPAVVLAMGIAWKAALLFACVGLLTRPATWVACLFGVYLVGLQYNFGKTDHMTAMFLFTTGIMALSRCGDALSIDALIRRWRGKSPVPPSGEYRWPVRMVWVLMAVIFFNAGMAKVLRGGLPWVFSENFAILLTQGHYRTSLPPLDWGLWFAAHPFVYKSAAAGAILGELSMCLALLDRRLRAVLPVMLLSMQIGIGLFMRVWFIPYMFVYIFWVPWDRLFLWLTRRGGAAANA